MNEKHHHSSCDHASAHTRLAHQTHVVLRLGQHMLAAGASAYRVQDGMEKLAHAVGIEQIHVQVSYTSITATAWANGTFRTEVVEQRNLGVNADKIDRFKTFIEELPSSILVEDAERQISAIHKRKPLYPLPLSALASGIACAAFAWLNLGGWVECGAVVFAACAGQAARKLLLGRHVNHFFTWMICGFIASGIYMGIITALQTAGYIDTHHSAGMVSAVLFLVPGFPLVTSILDLIRQDFIAGISRGTYVVMLLISTGAAVWAVSGIGNWSVSDVHPGYHLTALGLLAGRLIATFIASTGFAILFNAPFYACVLSGINGALINAARLSMRDAGANPIAAVGLAALAAGLIAHLMAHFTDYSRVTLSVPAVVVMIPGVPLYRAMTAMSNGQDISGAIESFVTLLLTISAIGVGLALARVLTDHNWRTEAPPEVPTLANSAASIPEHYRHRS